MAVEIRVFLAVDAFRQKSGTVPLVVKQAGFRARQVLLHRYFATDVEFHAIPRRSAETVKQFLPYIQILHLARVLARRKLAA